MGRQAISQPPHSASMDVHGFWNAYIDQGGGVRVRHPLPIRWNAPIDEAEAAFRQLLKRLSGSF